MTALLLILSALEAAGIFYLTGLYTTWYFYFLPIVLMIPLYWVSFVLVVLFAALVGLFFSKKKEIKKPYAWFYWVTVNGIPAVLGMSVEEGDDVRLDGKRLTPQTEHVVLMLLENSMQKGMVIY